MGTSWKDCAGLQPVCVSLHIHLHGAWVLRVWNESLVWPPSLRGSWTLWSGGTELDHFLASRNRSLWGRRGGSRGLHPASGLRDSAHICLESLAWALSQPPGAEPSKCDGWRQLWSPQGGSPRPSWRVYPDFLPASGEWLAGS